MFDWCYKGQHQLCRKEYKKFYFGPVGTGKKKKQGIIYTGEVVTCDCNCHRPAGEKKRGRPKATKRKK